MFHPQVVAASTYSSKEFLDLLPFLSLRLCSLTSPQLIGTWYSSSSVIIASLKVAQIPSSHVLIASFSSSALHPDTFQSHHKFAFIPVTPTRIPVSLPSICPVLLSFKCFFSCYQSHFHTLLHPHPISSSRNSCTHNQYIQVTNNTLRQPSLSKTELISHNQSISSVSPIRAFLTDSSITVPPLHPFQIYHHAPWLCLLYLYLVLLLLCPSFQIIWWHLCIQAD